MTGASLLSFREGATQAGLQFTSPLTTPTPDPPVPTFGQEIMTDIDNMIDGVWQGVNTALDPWTWINGVR